MRTVQKCLWASLALAAVSVVAIGFSQTQSQTPSPFQVAPWDNNSGLPTGPGRDANPDTSAGMRAAQREAKRRSLDRQNRLISDSDQIVRLAEELSSSVDGTKAEPASVALSRKAEEIEKLARGVKDHMKAN